MDCTHRNVRDLQKRSQPFLVLVPARLHCQLLLSANRMGWRHSRQGNPGR